MLLWVRCLLPGLLYIFLDWLFPESARHHLTGEESKAQDVNLGSLPRSHPGSLWLQSEYLTD